MLARLRLMPKGCAQ
ncbi:cell division inhibition protein DicB [Escherichia coli]|nr:cell division inhibition protein DicB [Escherichia coli]EFF5624575.1 hypothetical protein [Escherichia coli]EJZ0976802.1 hypothetical protein [Escherichia coli]